MQVAIVGLGRMGYNIALHLLEQGVDLVVWNRTAEKSQNLKSTSQSSPPKADQSLVEKLGTVTIAESVAQVVQKLTNQPKVVFLYVPAGEVTEYVFQELGKSLPPGSIIIDGGNSFYQDSQRRFRQLQSKNIHFLDMGTSGGLAGARHGACLMVGGDETVYKQVEPVLAKIAQKDGCGYFGPTGAGHYVKMIHNAIEYGMMGAIGEGLNLIQNANINPSAGGQNNNSKFKINLAGITKVWAHGSIVSGLLMDKAADALAKDPKLDSVAGEVPVGATEKEMEWLETLGLPMPVISAARRQRVDSRKNPTFTGRVIAALRREFGGHSIKEVK